MVGVALHDWSWRRIAVFAFIVSVLSFPFFACLACSGPAGVVSLSPTKVATTISCVVSPAEVVDGKAVTVSGVINPVLPGKFVTLTYTSPNASTGTRLVVTMFDGSYTDVYTPDATGGWRVAASWEGDSLFDGASSPSRSFTVIQKSGCLIATATYGSELSPQVQFLRGFRDHEVLTTFAGRSFMTVFNRFYYAFSPSVASAISSLDGLRVLVTVLLYPLMGALHLSAAVFSRVRFLPELGIILAGVVASTLITVIYLLPWTVLLCRLQWVTLSRRSIRWLGQIWAGSFLSMAVAEATQSSVLMMASTGASVLATMCLTAWALTRVITKPVSP
jgi:hypothetical protein